MFSLFQHSSTSLRTLTLLLFLWTSIARAELKNVFFHYMVGGVSESEATQDVQDAKALGVDAFAINLQSTTEPWSVEAVDALFTAANANDFKLFFSFDMTSFTDPSQFIPYLVNYIGNEAYYLHDGLPFVSTFYGGTLTFGESSPNEGWQVHYVDALAALGHETYFVPAFSDSTEADGADFYNAFPSVNGAFSWDASWPVVSNTNQIVNNTIDQTFLSSAQGQNKTVLMGLSSLQFKHLSPSENWYRAGSSNLLDRIEQVLDLSPDFLEIITWNDNGESHYFGNIWEDTMPASYSAGYDHSGWQSLVPTLIGAYKNGSKDIEDLVPTNGEDIQGAFWHHTLTSNANCGSDSLGMPAGFEVIQDVISIGLYASASVETDNLTMKAWSGGALVGTENVVKGFNKWVIQMDVGTQSVEIVDAEGNVKFSGQGPLDVVSESQTCNYNFQVVEIVAANGTTTTKRNSEGKRSQREEIRSGSGHAAHVHKHRAARLHEA